MTSEGFLVGGICICVLVGGARSCHSEGQWLGPELVVSSVCEFSMALGSLYLRQPVFNAQGYVPALLEN